MGDYIFENPDKKPLNELFLSVEDGGIHRQIAALSENWIEPRCHAKYTELPIKDNKIQESALLEEWLNETEWFNEEIEWLLELEYYKFWSYMVYDPGCITSVISFLQEAIPFYMPVKTLTKNEKIINLYWNVLKNVLCVICRLITPKESDSEFMDNVCLADLLYSKYLMSIPMIFDLIVAYGKDNIQILSKIIQTIFKIEPKYKIDLKIGLQFVQKSLVFLSDLITTWSPEQGYPLDDMTYQALDNSTTLNILLEAYPEARQICREIKMEPKISQFYEAIPILYKHIYNSDENSANLEILNFARVEFLSAFRSTVNIFIENIQKHPNKSLQPTEMFLGIMTEIVSDRAFLVDYQKIYPIEIDLDIIQRNCPRVDSFKIEFIAQAFLMAENPIEVEEPVAGPSNGNSNGHQEPCTSASLNNGASTSKSPPKSNIEQEIKNILDVFPSYGDGFVRKVLARYDSPELAISAILEGNLPPDLDSLDKSEIYIPPDIQDKVFLETGIRRLNIFDGDEFDVMTQDKIKGVIKSGKGFPGQPKTMNALLDDKSHIREMKGRYQEYTMVTEGDDYDDEYDDSFDAMTESENKNKKSYRPSAAVKGILVDEVDDDEDESEEEDFRPKKNPNDFCENPEAVRARYEQSRMNYRGRGGGSTRPVKDVVGNAKGQGQDTKTLQNRHSKDVNKSSRANHNRKSGASFKRGRGMF